MCVLRAYINQTNLIKWETTQIKNIRIAKKLHKFFHNSPYGKLWMMEKSSGVHIGQIKKLRKMLGPQKNYTKFTTTCHIVNCEW